MNTNNTPCPCGSNIPYELCCYPLIEKNEPLLTPEQVLRSRYTAYSLCKINHIEKTMTGPSKEGFSKKGTLNWAQQCNWQKLEIIQQKQITNTEALIEFKAYYTQKNKPKIIHETSLFKKTDNSWIYFSGIHQN